MRLPKCMHVLLSYRVSKTTRNCPPRGNIAPAQDDRGDGSFSCDVFGWNLGGSPPDCLKDVVVEHAKRQVRNTDLFTVQEFPRGKEGWSVERYGGLLTILPIVPKVNGEDKGLPSARTHGPLRKESRERKGFGLRCVS